MNKINVGDVNLPKKYPWQKWPDKTKNRKKSSYHGQTKEPSWKNSSTQDLKRSKKLYTYHGRTGHPQIHQTKTGKEYIMVRAKGGGTKRLYLTPEVKRKLESEKGYPR